MQDEIAVRTYRIPAYKVALVREGSVKSEVLPRFGNSRQVVEMLRSLVEDCDREVFYVAAVDSKNKVIGVNLVSMGSLAASLVHPREVYKFAVLVNAAGVVFLHNHPSGDPAPSREDRECTQRLATAGRVLGVRVLDHVILGNPDYFSFADAGLINQGEEVVS